jgi:hypothetical protein
MKSIGVTIVAAAALVLAACDRGARDDRGLLEKLSNRTGPDELAIVPQKELEAPPDFNFLPEPSAAAGNRADLDPRADFARAMTGSAPRNAAATAGDAAFLAAILAGTARGGLADDTVLFGGAGDLLDPWAELERLRALGIRTPAAPPRN